MPFTRDYAREVEESRLGQAIKAGLGPETSTSEMFAGIFAIRLAVAAPEWARALLAEFMAQNPIDDKPESDETFEGLVARFPVESTTEEASDAVHA